MVARFFFAWWLALFLAGCGSFVVPNDCVLADAEYREALRAQSRFGRAIPARIVRLGYAPDDMRGHAILVFRLDHGWFFYDSNFGTSQMKEIGTAFPSLDSIRRQAGKPYPVVSVQFVD